MIAPISYHDTVRAQLRYVGISPITPVTPASPADRQRDDVTRYTPGDRKALDATAKRDERRGAPASPAWGT